MFGSISRLVPRSATEGTTWLTPGWRLFALYALTFVALALWLRLYAWYPLQQYYATAHFDFGKLPEVSRDDILRQTTLVFLAVPLPYLLIHRLLATSSRLTRPMLVGLGVLIGGGAVLNLLTFPIAALDVYNYMAWLKVAYFYHQNPYIVTFSAFPDDLLTPYGWVGDISLSYGPVWLLVSAVPALLGGFADLLRTLLVYKLFNLLLIGAMGLVIGLYHRGQKQGLLAAYTFLASPIVLFEGIGNVHSDVMAAAFLLAGVIAFRWRSVAALSLVVASALVKLYTAPTIPLVFVAMLILRWPLRRVAVSLALTAALVVCVGLPFWAGGEMVHGFLRGVDTILTWDQVTWPSVIRETLRDGFGVDASGLIVFFFGLGIYGLVFLSILWRFYRTRALDQGVTDAFVLYIYCLNFLAPWYLIPAVALLALKRDRPGHVFLMTLSALGLAYYPISAWWWDSLSSQIQIHLLQAGYMSLPLLAYGLARWRERGEGNQTITIPPPGL